MDEGNGAINGAEPENSAPWEFRPLHGILRLLAYPTVVLAMFGVMNAVMFAVVVGLLMIPSSESAVEVLVGILWWILIVGAGIFCVRVFVALNRRLDLPKYMKKCPPGAVYFIRRPVLKSLTKTGYVSFSGDEMELQGTLSPNFLWPILTFAVLNTFFILLMFTGGPIIFLGGLDGFLLLLLYGFIFKRKTGLTVNQKEVKAVKCKGPILKIIFRKGANLPIGSLTVILPPEKRVQFLKSFDMTFPDKLPEDYRAALVKDEKQASD